MVLDVFGDAVDFILGFVDFDLGVGAGDGVDFSILLFLFEYRSFPDADGQLFSGQGYLELVGGGVGGEHFISESVFIDH